MGHVRGNMFREFPVSSCPLDPASWVKAGVRLNCPNDTFGRSLYHCAPNEEKSSLYEFCLRGSIGRFEKGLCVHSMSNGYLGVEKCDNFVYGCPNMSYINNEIYKYPACLEINTIEQCYMADQSCPNISRVHETSQSTEDFQAINVAAVLGSTFVVLGILVALILIYWCKGKNEPDLNINESLNSENDGRKSKRSLAETMYMERKNISKNIKDYGIDFILRCELKAEHHDYIASLLRIPVEILRWPKERLKNFIANLQEKVAVHHGQCMVVGCGGAGKTTLLNNMRGEPDVDPESTIGIDCHPNIFIVDGFTLQATKDKERTGPCTQISLKNLSFKEETAQENAMQSERFLPVHSDLLVHGNVNSESNKDISDTESIENEETSLVYEQTIIEETKRSFYEERNEFIEDESEAEDSHMLKNEKELEIENEPKPLNQREDEKNKQQKSKDLTSVRSEGSKKVSIMDFAGECVYYTCHHIYFSPRAIFILVVDVSKDLNEAVIDSSLNHELMYSGWSHLEYVRYWLGSIHYYSSPIVPVILVASHSENTFLTETEYLTKIRSGLPSNLLHHLSSKRTFKVKKDKNENTEAIKNCIVDILEKQQYWGERIPTLWVSLEHILHSNKALRIWKTDDLWKYVNEEKKCEIEKKEDLITALIFFNDIGVILFKDQANLRENIILDVQWFVDAFKCIIVDEKHIHMLNRDDSIWDLYKSYGILNKSLLKEAWKDYSFKKHKDELILHMINLGMMAELSREEYYVPCMNKRPFDAEILKGVTVSSTICFLFQYFPLVIFHRLIATCMQRYGWELWERKQRKTDTKYYIFHTATIFWDGAYPILIGVTQNRDHTYSIELQIIASPKQTIDRSISIEIREKVQNILNEVIFYYPAVNKASENYKIGYRCCMEPFYTLRDHRIWTTTDTEECMKCNGRIDKKELTSYWKKDSSEDVSGPIVKYLLDEPELITLINADKINTVTCLSDEEIWTCGFHQIMKLYNLQGKLLRSIKTKSGNTPDDMAVTKSGDLVYTAHDERTIYEVKNKRIQKLISVHNWRPCYLCSTSSDELLVFMLSVDYKQSRIVRYSGSKKKQIIQFDDKDQPLYSIGLYFCIIENRNLDICVSDEGAKAVVVVNQAGKLRFRYTGHTPTLKNNPFSPRGITTDSQSHILTADYNNDCVHIIDQDGKFLRYIHCGLREPWGLCTDTNDNLFVAQMSNKQVMKIKYILYN